ncbi:PAS domain S-box protein [Flavitalea flava]
MSKPLLIFATVFIVLMALTQFLVYQQYKISKQQQTDELIHEAAAAKDRFRNILFNDLAAANTLAIIYKQYGVPDKFDSIASQIIKNSRYAQVLQITENGIVKNVYPDSAYKNTIGTNVNADPTRKAEETRAVNRKEIYFAGPRRLRFGDTGILGKVPILVDNKVKAVATVLTRLSVVRKALEPTEANADKAKFAYQLLKAQEKDTLSFALSDIKPANKSEYIDIEIPEGDWLLRISYSNGYASAKFPYELVGLGILLSFIASLAVYRKVLEPGKLNRIIDEKTDQLIKSEKYFRTLIETSSDAIILIDAEGKVLYQTPSAEKILGYTFFEMQKIDGLELIHADDRADGNKMFGELISNPGNIIHQKHRIKHKDGSYIQIEGTYRNLLNDENVKAIVYSYKDVTEKMLSEQNLARYNRELTLLNKINDIILRASDELQLYEEVCDCIVTVGNYQLAWICHKPDAGTADQTVAVLVAVGDTEYLTGAKIVLDDPELSNGPTAIVLNTGKTVINNDLANSTYFGQWLKNAGTFGIRSSAALPLNLGDDKSGALIIYSRGANAFDEHEVSTLNRLAASLSLAVQHIHNREELVESENRFRRAFEDSAIGMGLTSIEEDSMGRWLKVNRSLCEMLGYSEDELTSMTFLQITHPEDLAKDLAAQDRVLRDESDTYRMEKRNIHKDGSIVWINLNVSVIKDKDMRPLYLVAQVENITGKIESQTRFQDLVEHFVVGVYIIQNNKLVYVNPMVIEETGYTEDEIIGMPFDKFIYPDDLALVTDIVDARIKEGIKTVRYEARIKQKNAGPLWYEILGGSTLYQGAPALIGTMVNITERKAVYDELKRSEANLKSIFDTTDVAYLLLDAIYNIIALNQNMKDIYLHIAGSELEVGDNFADSLLPEKRENALAIYERVSQTNRSEDYETSYFKNGAYTHFLANVKPINQGIKVIGLCISVIDITERKNAIEQLIQLNQDLQNQARELAISNAGLELSEKRYSELFNFSPLPAWVVDVNTLRFLDINNAAVVHYGYTRNDFLSMTLNEIRPVEEIPNLLRSVAETLKVNDIISREIMIHKKKNGELINVEIQIASIYYSGAKAYIAIATDITERQKSLAQLNQLNENLQQQARELAISNAELEQFAYMASHDLQEPLRMVTSFLTQLERKYSGVLDEKAKQYIYFATDGAKRMRQLILDLLEYSRVGRTEDELETVDFNNLIKEILILFRRKIEESNASVNFSGLPAMSIYKSPVRQVFQNLIDNALKYQKSGSAPVIEISCVERKIAFEFIVSDNGIGIDPEYFDQIFIIFKRLHYRDEYDGTGMGLAITKKIIEYMGGKIWVSSKEGEGSAFHFTIPKHLV